MKIQQHKAKYFLECNLTDIPFTILLTSKPVLTVKIMNKKRLSIKKNWLLKKSVLSERKSSHYGLFPLASLPALTYSIPNCQLKHFAQKTATTVVQVCVSTFVILSRTIVSSSQITMATFS